MNSLKPTLQHCVQLALAVSQLNVPQASDADLQRLLSHATLLSNAALQLLDRLATDAATEPFISGIKRAVTRLLLLTRNTPRAAQPDADLPHATLALSEALAAAHEHWLAGSAPPPLTDDIPCRLHARAAGCAGNSGETHWQPRAAAAASSLDDMPHEALAALLVAGLSHQQMAAQFTVVRDVLGYVEHEFRAPSVFDSCAPSFQLSAANSALVASAYRWIGPSSVCDAQRTQVYSMPDPGADADDDDGPAGALVAVRRMPYGGDAARRRAIVARAALLERATPHRNIIAPFALADVVAEKALWLVSEHVVGCCLGLYIGVAPLPADVTRYVTLELTRALAHLHSLGIAHRRIAPTSIWICDDGSVKLADFSACTDTLLGAATDRAGPLAFMSPEMVRGEPHGLTTDVWSLGKCVLWMMGKVSVDEQGAAAALALALLERAPFAPLDNEPDAQDFLAGALRVKPDTRTPISALLKHEFLRSSWRGVSARKLKALAANIVANTDTNNNNNNNNN